MKSSSLFSSFLCAFTLSFSGITYASPVKTIIDHDGAFDDYFAVLSGALASQKNNPKINLIAVTTNPVGESYCTNSNLYPEGTEGVDSDAIVREHSSSIDGITEKVLALAGYSIPIYSGCEESMILP